MQEEKIKVFNRIYDLFKHLDVSVAQIDVNTDFTAFYVKELKPLPFKSPVCRLNYFVFNFTKHGRGSYTIDEQTFEIKPNTIHFTNPGHCRVFEWTEVNEVFLITVSESFLKANVHRDIFEEFPFLLSETYPAKVVSSEVFAEFEYLFKQIHQVYLSSTPYRTRLIGTLLVAMLLKIKEYFWLDYNPICEGNRSSQIVKNFKRLLEKHYRDLHSGKVNQVFRVQDYADAQNLHPNYLSNVIKSKTERPIGSWIAEKTIIEAKSLLQNSNVSVKEIAYNLGFTDAAHFANYFKKHTNTSPLTFRKAYATITS
ncbi:MAG: AraC family transcriptional regulator [Mucilaginibacter sp.]|uniref:AraC family transcriptional regulator n=1 Tax=Mucilaginibacter sp. TaxID=1882438 RepID=UPI0031A917B0